MTHSDKRNLSTSCSFETNTCTTLHMFTVAITVHFCTLHIFAPTILKLFSPENNQCNLKLLQHGSVVSFKCILFYWPDNKIWQIHYSAENLTWRLQGIVDKNCFSSWTTSYFSLNTYKNIQLETYSSTLLWSLEFQSSEALKCRHSCAKMSRSVGQSPHHSSNCDFLWKRRILVIFLVTKNVAVQFLECNYCHCCSSKLLEMSSMLAAK